MNKIVITGRLTRDPEIKTSSSGLQFCNFAVAVDRYSKDEKAVDFFDCIAFRKTAEFVNKWFMKGKPIMVVGKMQSREYTSKDGVKRRVWELVADEAEFFGGEKKDQAAVQAAGPATPTAVTALDLDDNPFTDELPPFPTDADDPLNDLPL